MYRRRVTPFPTTSANILSFLIIFSTRHFSHVPSHIRNFLTDSMAFLVLILCSFYTLFFCEVNDTVALSFYALFWVVNGYSLLWKRLPIQMSRCLWNEFRLFMWIYYSTMREIANRTSEVYLREACWSSTVIAITYSIEICIALPRIVN